MKVLLLSRYGRMGASSRLRSYQYLPYLKQQGIEVTANALFDDRYLQLLYSKKTKSIAAVVTYYTQRLACLLTAKRYDLVWIEKELLPSLPAFAEMLLNKFRIPYIVDYDDAIFHRYDQHKNPVIRSLLKNKIGKVMQQARTVIAGNSYLAEYARKWQAARVEILPTVIDLERYSADTTPNNERLTIGWIGTPATQAYLKIIAPVLTKASQDYGIQIFAVGARELELPGVTLHCIPWSEAGEVAVIQQFDIGIMPLPDQAFERGKCGYKLIQYMACAKPVIASPIGVNSDIVKHGETGLLAINEQEWLHAIATLKDNKEKSRQMGRAGRTLVESDYCLQVTAPRLHKIIEQALP